MQNIKYILLKKDKNLSLIKYKKVFLFSKKNESIYSKLEYIRDKDIRE